MRAHVRVIIERRLSSPLLREEGLLCHGVQRWWVWLRARPMHSGAKSAQNSCAQIEHYAGSEVFLPWFAFISPNDGR